MLKIYDKNHSAIGYLVKYKDCKVESDVSTGDKSLSFTYLAKRHNLVNEMYVRTRSDEYVIKEVSESSDGFPQAVAALNLEELEAQPWQTLSFSDVTIDEAARTILAGTGWTVGECNVMKRRNAGMMLVSSLGAIQGLCTAFMCEPVFDTINKTVSFYEERGEDKGVYFMAGLNLKKLQKKSVSYDFYTRIVPIGADGLTIESINSGKNYLENYQYSDKVRTYIWEDTSYTDASALLEDAEKKLDDLSKPEVSYSADVRDLAAQKPEYSVLSYGLGDTITLIDADTGTREKQRIKKMTVYPDDPDNNTCEIANTVLTFEELQEKVRAAAELANNVITSDGKIYVSNILNFEKGLSESVTVGGIQASVNTVQGDVATMQGSMVTMQGDIAEVKEKIGELEVNFLTVEEADIKYATIASLNATDALVHSLQGDYAEFKTMATDELSAHTARLDTVSGDLADYKTVVAEELTVAKGWMLEGAIGSAQISDLDVNKLKAGTLNTSIVNIAGSDGHLQITDNTIQISDDSRVRVQIGKDASGDYTLAVWDSAGNLIWDALGATENTIQRKIIRDKMVADDANIQGYKLDIESVVVAVNGATTKISGTAVQVGNKTLEVALSEQEQTIEDYGEALSSQDARISANEKSITLKVSTEDFTAYQSTVTGQISTAKSEAISAAASDASTKADQALADANNYTNAEVSTVNKSLSTTNQEISVMQGQIALKVEQTDVEQTVDSRLASYSTTTQMNTAIDLAKDSITAEVSETYAKQTELSAVSGKVTSLEEWKAEASQKITRDGIISTVGNYYAYQTDLAAAENRITEVETQATQTAEKFNWIVKSGTSSTDFTLTDRTATLIAQTISLNGDVKVSGDMLVDGAVTAEKIATDAIKSKNYAYSSGVYSEEGTFFNLADGSILSKNFGIDASGNAYFKGNLAGATGSFTGSIVANDIVIKETIKMRGADSSIDRNAVMLADYGGTLKIDIGDPEIDTDEYQTFVALNGNTILLNGTVQAYGGGIDASSNRISCGALYCSSIDATGEIRSTSPNAFRAVCGNYGMFIRNDGGNTYFMLTASGDPYGTWNSLRPLYFSDSTGVVTLGSGTVITTSLTVNTSPTINASLTVTGNLNAGTVSTYSGNYKPVGSRATDKYRTIEVATNVNSSGTYYISVTGQYGSSSYSSKNFTATTSDMRLKTDIVPTEVEALPIIQQLQMRKFRWKETGIVQNIGFIADELELIDPALAIGGGYNEDGSLNAKGVNEFYLTGIITKGIQELCAINTEHDKRADIIISRQDEQESRIESLQYQLNEARAQITQQAEEIARMKGMLQAAA